MTELFKWVTHAHFEGEICTLFLLINVLLIFLTVKILLNNRKLFVENSVLKAVEQEFELFKDRIDKWEGKLRDHTSSVAKNEDN